MEGFLAALLAFLVASVIALVIIAAYYVFMSFVFKKLFEKAGRNGNMGWVPFYRWWILFDMAGLNWYWFVLMFAGALIAGIASALPFVGSLLSAFVVQAASFSSLVLYINLNKKFNTEKLFIILLVLVPIVGLPVLAFNKKYEFNANAKVEPDGIFGDFGFIKPKEETKKEEHKEEPKEEHKKETKKPKKEEE